MLASFTDDDAITRHVGTAAIAWAAAFAADASRRQL
jgi:hypothetical protein